MSYNVTVSYGEVLDALKGLVGLRLQGSIYGPPTSKFPLRTVVENAMKEHIIGVEEYQDVKIVGVGVEEGLHLLCHFNKSEPDDFCLAVRGDNPWSRVVEAAARLSKATRASYTALLSAVLHALQGIVSGEEEGVEEITDPDQVIEELLTWLPEYISVTD